MFFGGGSSGNGGGGSYPTSGTIPITPAVNIDGFIQIEYMPLQ